MKLLSEVYRKMRNTCRFLLGNIGDFDPGTHYLPPEQRTELDRYALSVLATLVEKIKRAYEDFEFHIVHHSLNKFFTVDLSATYLDILKDRLYCDSAGGKRRRSAQSTLYDLLVTVVPWMSPILSFTSEEIWQHLPGKKGSVFLEDLPQGPASWKNGDLEARWGRIWNIRDEILKSLEGARQRKEIGHPLDARVCLSAQGETEVFLKAYEAEWAQICITSQVEIVPALKDFDLESSLIPSLKIKVEKARGAKCERCWNYSEKVGDSKEHPTLCDRCAGVVSF